MLKSKAEVPDLNIETGDITNLVFGNSEFDGYWSLGVVEHLESGAGKAFDEMARVIKENGYLFITFPHMSKLRKIKAVLVHLLVRVF